MSKRDRLAEPLVKEHQAWMKRRGLSHKQTGPHAYGFNRELTSEEQAEHQALQKRWEETVPDTDIAENFGPKRKESRGGRTHVGKAHGRKGKHRHGARRD